MATDVLVSEQTGHALIKCKDCKKVGRIDFTVINETRAFNGRPSYSSRAMIGERLFYLNAYNSLDGVLYEVAARLNDHGKGECDTRSLKVNRVKGILVHDKPCDARCMGATGPNCSCSCGGDNHGGNHSAW